MKKMTFMIFVLLTFILSVSCSLNKWSVGDDYVKLNNHNLFLNGVNYVPPLDWMMMLENWDETQAEKDIVGMKSIGVKIVRFFPLWHLTQPKPNQLDEKIMQRIDRVLDLAEKHGLYFQITPITGWMSGGVFLPDWAVGNIFTDPEIIEGEKFLVREFAKRYKNHPALQGFDFGNEINVLIDQMKLDVTPAEIDEWMQTIYKTFKEVAPHCNVTNGIGTGFDPYFNIEAISKSCDYMSVHSYPYFHGTFRLDPFIGQRTLYSGNFITEWAAMVHKPVLLQEHGNVRPGIAAAKELRVYYMSSWAEGAAGYFWWGSHMIKPDYFVNSPGLRTEYSIDPMKKGDLRGDRTMGLLSTENSPEISGLEYKKCTQWIDQVGVDWEDILPVCYILMPHTTDFHDTMLKFINPFVLAKQAHFDVKLLWEDQEVPEDASAIFISGFHLSTEGTKNIQKYLNSGGKVYQSFYNDLSSNILLENNIPIIADSMKLSFGDIGDGTSKMDTIEMYEIKLKESKVVPIFQSAYFKDNRQKSQPAFVKTSSGKGTYYYMALNVEESLGKVRNPWAKDDSYLFYKALQPETDIQIDNKYIEFYHKKRGDEELLVLINHEDSSQNLSIYSKNQIQLEDAIEQNVIGKGTSFSLVLGPAEVLLLKVSNQK